MVPDERGRRYTPRVANGLAILFALLVGGTVLYLMRPLYYGFVAGVISRYKPEHLGAGLSGTCW